MGKSTTKITRRLFNLAVSALAFFGFNKTTKCDEDVLISNDNMEILIIPEEYRHPYSNKVREVLFNHKKAGKTNKEIRDFILSQCKIIKVPIK